jgi:hypothetical protein
MNVQIHRAALVLWVLMLLFSVVFSGASLARAAAGETESVTGHAISSPLPLTPFPPDFTSRTP